MSTVFVLMRAAAAILMAVALGMFFWTGDFRIDHPIHIIIGILVIGSEFLNWRYKFDDTWRKTNIP